MINRSSLALLSLLAAGSASAIPIHFDVDGPNSNVGTSGLSLCVGCSVSITPSAALDSQVFDLNVGQSVTFDFFDITASGISGLILGTVSANLAFELPTLATATGVAIAGAAWGFGVGVGGLTFDILGQPSNILFSSGGEFSVAFSNAYDDCQGGWLSGCTLSDTVTATVTLLSAPSTAVPEPTTLSLLGAGLLGLGLVRRLRRPNG